MNSRENCLLYATLYILMLRKNLAENEENLRTMFLEMIADGDASDDGLARCCKKMWKENEMWRFVKTSPVRPVPVSNCNNEVETWNGDAGSLVVV